MDVYYTVAGALVIGTMLLLGSLTVSLATRVQEAARNLRAPESRRTAASVAAVALIVGLWLGFGSLSFSSAFERTTEAYVPPPGIDWEPVGSLPSTGFDRFDYGTATNAALSRRS